MGAYFDTEYEQDSINTGITRQQEETGVTVDWWFWDPRDSRVSNIYDEDVPGASRHWRGPYPMPVYQASRTEGTLEDTGDGAYVVDNVTLVIGYGQAYRHGLRPVVDRAQHLKDRFVWDGLVWSPSSIVARNLLGGRGTRATVLVQATQVRDDELVNDTQFQQYAEPGYVEPDPGFVA